MRSAPIEVGDVVAGKYEVERILGEGGMGVVVAARHRDLDQRVAVKFLLPEIAKRQDAAERFRREARAAVRITSEHVARVLDVGSSEDGVPYMVMEYLQGDDLAAEIRSRGQLPVNEAVSYVLQACEAVAEAHAAGIVHRDLKPANLFLAQRADGSRLIKVLDFGISKSTTAGSMSDLALTSTSALIGSPLYMSPEQMHSAKSVDGRTDVWSLGAITFQLLAGRPPYVAESIPQLCSALLNDAPPPLAGFRNDIHPELENAILGALAKDRNQRFGSVAAFAHALAPFAPESRVHAERAGRVLAGSSGNFSRQVIHSSSPGVTTGSQPGHDPTIASGRPPGEKTLASWGKTGDAPPPARSMGPIFAAAGAGLLLVAILVVWGILHVTSRAEASGVEPVAPTAGEPASQPPVPTITVEPVATETPPVVTSATTQPPTTKPTSRTSNKPPEKKPTEPKLPDFGGRR
jgi:eukaryotic-like serine/threonine-protein kinase